MFTLEEIKVIELVPVNVAFRGAVSSEGIPCMYILEFEKNISARPGPVCVCNPLDDTDVGAAELGTTPNLITDVGGSAGLVDVDIT